MNAATATHAQVAADALAVASAADPFLSFLGTGMDEIRAKYRALIEGWDAEGWTATTLRAFSDFMDAARSRATESTWLENDLDVRRAQVGEDVRRMSFAAGADPGAGETPVSLPGAGVLHDLMWIAIAVGVALAAVAVLRFKR